MEARVRSSNLLKIQKWKYTSFFKLYTNLYYFLSVKTHDVPLVPTKVTQDSMTPPPPHDHHQRKNYNVVMLFTGR